MWFFDGKKDSLSGLSLEFHREKTQKISVKPPLEDLEDGFISCSQCGVEIDIGSYDALSIGRCAGCDMPVFIPMRVKDAWLYEPLGGGGMGSVYHSFHRRNESVEFAVKVLPRKKRNDQSLAASLMREAEMCWDMGEHQHLNRVLDYGLWEDEYFAVFQYIDGIRLDHLIDSPVKRPEKQILLWALQILSAEQHMYDKGYLFRDLKPQNIMIDTSGNVKLIDFGLAMPLEEAANNVSNQIQGSPYYLPPERIVGSGESQYSEIYSLGMLLFHVLAKKPYYSADDIKSLVSKHVVSVRVNSLAGKLPYKTSSKLVAALEKMMARVPDRRFQTYKECASVLFKIYKELA